MYTLTAIRYEQRSCLFAVPKKVSIMISRLKFSIILFGLPMMLKFAARRYPTFAARLKERNLVAQIKARDEDVGRWIEIRDGRITSGAGPHPRPDITLAL